MANKRKITVILNEDVMGKLEEIMQEKEYRAGDKPQTIRLLIMDTWEKIQNDRKSREVS